MNSSNSSTVCGGVVTDRQAAASLRYIADAIERGMCGIECIDVVLDTEFVPDPAKFPDPTPCLKREHGARWVIKCTTLGAVPDEVKP